jgi:release factor glutamine methyltransferase
LKEARIKLQVISDEPNSTLWVILQESTGKTYTWLAAHEEFILTRDQSHQADQLLSQVIQQIPLAYLIKHWAFYDLDLYINSSVLIPRPETELMAEAAIAWLKEHPKNHCAADVGTGSGCISIAIAKSINNLFFISTDISRAALDVAKLNIHKYHLENSIYLVQTTLLDACKTRFNLICANLPYIPTKKLDSLKVSQHEPYFALDGGDEGLDYIHDLLIRAPSQLHKNGLLLIEINSDQGDRVEKLAQQNFPNANFQILKDLSGLPRLLFIENCSS